VQGHDYIYPGAAGIQPNTQVTSTGPFIRQDVHDRPADIYGGTVTLHTGGQHQSYLLLPIIPVGIETSQT